MVRQGFANPCPFLFSDTTLHQNQLDDAKGSSEEDQMALSRSHLPTTITSQNNQALAGHRETKVNKVDHSCQRSCPQSGEQGERLPLFPCNRTHTVTRGTWVKVAQRVTLRSTQDLGDAEAVGTSWDWLGLEWWIAVSHMIRTNQPTSQMTETRPIKRSKGLWSGFRQHPQTDLSILCTRSVVYEWQMGELSPIYFASLAA